MAPDTLYDMVSLMSERVGLVHQMPFTTDRAGFAGTLEKVYFGTGHCRMYLFINLIGVNCVTGMSCLMRKPVLDNIGGLQGINELYVASIFTKPSLTSQQSLTNASLRLFYSILQKTTLKDVILDFLIDFHKFFV